MWRRSVALGWSVQVDQAISPEAFGRLVGISRQATDKHIAKGVLREGATLGEWLRAYCERLRGEAAGRQGDESKALTRAKTREAEAKAQMSELQFHRELRQLVPVEEVEPALSAWASVARTEVQQLVERVVEAIESKHGIEVTRDLYDGQLSAAYAAISSYPRNMGGGDGAGGDAVGAAASDGDQAMAG